MKELSAHQAKRTPPKESAPKPKIDFKYTVDGVLYSFAELHAQVRAVNPGMGESKLRARLSRGIRTMAQLTPTTLPAYKPKLGLRGRS